MSRCCRATPRPPSIMNHQDPGKGLATHRLQPLLAPRSVAVVGASTRTGSFGNTAITELVAGGFTGRIYPVNPRYDSVEGFRCFDSLADLEEVPELVQLCIANERVEAEFDLAVSLGVPASVIYGSCYVPDDRPGNTLLGRLSAKAREAGMAVCGGNCMGYRNLHGGVLTGIYRSSGPELAQAPAALVSHSGTAFSILSNLDGRIGFMLSVSAGQELATTSADYLDYVLEVPGIRCVAMFLEAIRDPAGFVQAMRRAHALGVAVVVLKVGRSEAAARFAVSHSGALVGDDAAYDAFFERHGIVRVDSMDELVNVLQLFTYGKPLADGGLTAALDSGGKRELLVDTAEEVNLALAQLGTGTVTTLSANLDADLDPVNPLDHWGTGGEGWRERLVNCVVALAEDDNSAVCAITGSVPWYAELVVEVAKHTEKPLALLTDFLRAGDHDRALALNRAGFAVLAGERAGLKAIKAAMKHRDYCRRPPVEVRANPDRERLAGWKEELSKNRAPDEATSLALLADFGIPTLPSTVVENESALVETANTLGYPVVLKTATPGIVHKSDVGGVLLNLADNPALVDAYRDLSSRLGPRVMVTRQARPDGVEMALGVVRDPLVGALVMIGLGGTLIELLDDKVCVPAPSNHAEVAHALDRLKCRPLLDGVRGQPGVDIEALINCAVGLSILAHDLVEIVAEIDVNPVLVSPQGCMALDALVITAPAT